MLCLFKEKEFFLVKSQQLHNNYGSIWCIKNQYRTLLGAIVVVQLQFRCVSAKTTSPGGGLRCGARSRYGSIKHRAGASQSSFDVNCRGTLLWAELHNRVAVSAFAVAAHGQFVSKRCEKGQLPLYFDRGRFHQGRLHGKITATTAAWATGPHFLIHRMDP